MFPLVTLEITSHNQISNQNKNLEPTNIILEEN